MSMSNSQEVLTSTLGAKKKPRTDSYSAATLRRNDDQLSRPYHHGYCSATVKQRNPYRSGDDGHHLLRLRLDLCAGADPRRDVFRPLWQQSDLCPVNFLLVAVYPAAKFHPRPKIPAASAHGTRRQRSALLSGQQPHRQHLVPSACARGQRQRIQLVNI